jgi:RNA polymerase sigma factor (sigma-70 family)
MLDRIRAGDEVGWDEFFRCYRPLILLRGGDRGLRDDEKQDLVQDVMVSVFRGQRSFRYDRAKGRYRDFLKKVIDRRAFDMLRKRRPEERELAALDRDGAMLTSADFEETERRWDDAWRQHLFEEALARVRTEVTEKTYQAFEMSVLDNVDPRLTAETLDIGIGSVYMAKNRVLKRLRPIIAGLEADL